MADLSHYYGELYDMDRSWYKMRYQRRSLYPHQYAIFQIYTQYEWKMSVSHLFCKDRVVAGEFKDDVVKFGKIEQNNYYG